MHVCTFVFISARLLAHMVSIFGEPDPLSGAADGARSNAAGIVESSVGNITTLSNPVCERRK